MCKVVYIAADKELPLITEGDPPPPLSVRELTADEAVVRGVLTQPFVYFVGSYTGCSCGFDYAAGADLEADGRSSVRRFREYLEAVVPNVGSLAIFPCWDGDEANGASEHVEVSSEFFADDADQFALPEGWHASIRVHAS